MLEFKQRDNGPLVVPNQAENFDNWRVTLAERCAASIILPAIAKMNSGHALMVPFEESQAIPVAGGEVANIQNRLEVGGKGEALLNACLIAECIRVRQIVVIMKAQEHAMLAREWNQPVRQVQSVRAHATLRS